MKRRDAAAGPVSEAEAPAPAPALAAPALAAPAGSTAPAAIIAMQRSAGNAAVGRMLAAQLSRQPAPPQTQPAPMTLGAAQAQIATAKEQQIEEAAAAVNDHRSQDPISIPMPTGTISLPQADALQLYETAVQRRMAMFHEWRTSELAKAPADVAASQGVTAAAVPGSQQVTSTAPVAPATAPPAGAGGVSQGDLDRYAAQRALADRLRKGGDAGLQALKRITRGRADRWRHPRQEVVESVLAAIQLEAVGLAEADVAAGGDPHAAAVKNVSGQADANWCGYFAQYSYRVAEEPQRLRQSLFHTANVENLFTYTNDTRTPAGIIVGGKVELLKTVHAGRNASRRWWDAATLRSTAPDQMPLRPGDIVLVDNGGKPGPNHIQMVRSWDPATRMLFTIDGNGGGYVVDNSAGAATTAPGSAKEARVEASTGLPLKEGPGAGHAGVGAAELGSQPDPAVVEAAWRKDEASEPWQKYKKELKAWQDGGGVGEEPKAPPTPLTDAARKTGGAQGSRVYGVGRFSIMDFEEHDYTTAPIGSVAPPPGKR